MGQLLPAIVERGNT